MSTQNHLSMQKPSVRGPAFVTVKDMYGKRFHVLPSDVASSRTLLRMHHPRTGKPYDMERDGHNTHLHRGNICPHPRAGFVSVTIFGDTWRQCPECEAAIQKHLDAAKPSERAQ